MELKNIIKSEREKRNMTMKELADKVGVSEGTISRWESGEIANMRRDKILSLSLTLDIPLGTIMGWEQDEKHKTKEKNESNTLTPDIQKLLSDYDKLNEKGKEKAREYTSDLTEQPKYTEKEKEMRSLA